MKKIDISFLQSELVRTSDWIQFSDKKTGFLSVYYSAMAGFVISQWSDILGGGSGYGSLETLYFLVFILFTTSFLIGIYYLFRSVFPQLKNSNLDNCLFYFGHIANKKLADYIDGLKNLSEEEVENQLAEQIHTTSVIANIKMTNVQKSTQSLVVSIVLLVFFLFII